MISKMNDPIVQEIKKQIEEEFDHDAQKYLAHVYEAQKQHGSKLVRGQPKPLQGRPSV